MNSRRSQLLLALAIASLCSACIVDTGPDGATCTAWRFDDGNTLISGDRAWFAMLDEGFTINFDSDDNPYSCGGASLEEFAEGIHTQLLCQIAHDLGPNPGWIAAIHDWADFRPKLTLIRRDDKVVRGYFSGLALRQDFNYSATPPTGTHRIVYYTLSFKAAFSYEATEPTCKEELPPEEEEVGGCSGLALRQLCDQTPKCSSQNGTCATEGGEQIELPDNLNGAQCRQATKFLNERCN